ncbi:unnamed protein product, partial [Strongylus vulgaris]
RSTPPTGQATVLSRSRPAPHLFTNDDYVLSTAFQSSGRQLTRMSDETGTSSSHVSEKTSSSGDARDTDSETETVGLLSERTRARKARRRCDDSPPGSQPPSSGYHSNNQSSNSSSSSPIDRTTALSISNPAFNASSSICSSSGFPDIHPGPSGMSYRRSSPPPYHSDIHNSYAHQPEIIEQQKRKIERLIRENEMLKRQMAATCPSLLQSKSERSQSDASAESFDSLGSEGLRNALAATR